MDDDMTKPRYEDRITSFVDILGFSDRVVNSSDETLPDLIDMVRSFRKAFDDGGAPDEDIVIPFSDGFMRARSNDIAPLFFEVLGFVHGIVDSVYRGHFVRGAISHGKIYYDRDTQILISPSFISAYQMEHSEAVVPRVIVDPATLREFRTRKQWWKDSHDYSVESEYVYGCLRLDRDGYYFVDYFRAMWGEQHEDVPELTRRHQELLVTRLSSDDLRHDVWKKFVWVANYHNLVLNELPDMPGTEMEGWKRGMEIPEELLHR